MSFPFGWPIWEERKVSPAVTKCSCNFISTEIVLELFLFMALKP